MFAFNLLHAGPTGHLHTGDLAGLAGFALVGFVCLIAQWRAQK